MRSLADEWLAMPAARAGSPPPRVSKGAMRIGVGHDPIEAGVEVTWPRRREPVRDPSLQLRRCQRHAGTSILANAPVQRRRAPPSAATAGSTATRCGLA